MQPKTKAITAAVTGSALGVAGLAWLAMPASAGEAPQLPSISAEELVQSVLSTQTPALDGTVQVDNNLGLPVSTLPGGVNVNVDAAHVYNDGNGSSKLSIEQGASDTTVVHNGNTVWTYNSKNNTATKSTLPAGAPAPPQLPSDPAASATQLLAKVRESSTVSVEGTARVAGRAAYELVLTPKPTEHTVLREVRVAVDAEKRVPLRLAVMTYGTADAALQVAFSDIEFTPQPASEFQFTPPQGAKVTEQQAQVPERAKAADALTVVGDGWDTVVTGTFPADALSPQQGKGGRNVDPKAMLSQFGKQVSGPFGTGYVITTKVGSALITSDGRFAAGAVTEQALVDALGAK
ncbi:outer membrane lipoprotein carrier protein LolA [Amycolatopsis acidiphila]|uniref:Outer membrane lipoprotein carrier protein LolA n=1 Tax=Amycolatopsis acidiphila TaxID=715473 RepID=A0A558A498_9PSEU|nr:sigma-E factor regulatory protein RseB domain-containing protein [Amycolatopsis acidiphila]TVT19104.1 outer membrane lipoprotein carrier protein LolA [Amycolatopsis acidiphila]UIJ58926.1 outer membrane lipoprotein carrier protein LolA [Amycolatopsis acidiphila]GHG72815.1 membrane protein [Amycolatopsis acidiphila]